MGGLAGAAIGLVATPLAGAPAGVVVKEVVASAGHELYHRLLAPRQAARVGAALATTIVDAQEQLEAGATQRQDGFFEERGEDRSEAEEIFEAVLIHAANAYQEKKLPYIGRFFSRLSFRTDIATAEAHRLLRVADGLSYRQLVLIAYIGHGAPAPGFDLSEMKRAQASGEFYDAGIFDELEELSSVLGLIGVGQPGGEVSLTERFIGAAESRALDLSRLQLTRSGRLLFELMGLDLVPESDTEAARLELNGVQPN